MGKQEFDQAEFLRTLERVAEERGYGDQPMHSAFDPKLAKDVRDEKLRGNRIERYEQALRSLGMVWLPKEALGVWNDGTPHKESMWIHPDKDMHVAFTETDILQLFSGPEDLWLWVKDKEKRLACQRAGVILPG